MTDNNPSEPAPFLASAPAPVAEKKPQQPREKKPKQPKPQKEKAAPKPAVSKKAQEQKKDDDDIDPTLYLENRTKQLKVFIFYVLFSCF